MAFTDLSSSLIGVQFTRETTAGTIVAATRKFPTLNIEMNPEANIATYQAQGSLVSVGTVEGEEWSSGTVKGPGDWNELSFLLDNILQTAAPVVHSGGTIAFDTTFAASATANTPTKTWSVEWGDPASGANAFNAGYGQLTDLTLKFSRKAVEVDGKIMSQRMSTGFTMTPSGVTTIAKASIPPGTVDLVIGDTWASLATNPTIDRGFVLDVSLGNRFVPVWPLKSTNTSYSSTVAGKLKADAKLTLGADSTSIQFLTALRISGRKFLRVKAVSSNFIEGSTPYSVIIDMAVEVAAIAKHVDHEGVYAHEWTFALVNDSSGWFTAKTVNQIGPTNL